MRNRTITQTAGATDALPVIGHWLAGRRDLGSGARCGPVFDPATGRASATLRYADAATVDAALRAASDAFPAWRATPAVKRARVMFRFKTLIEQHRAELAALITAEHGKLLSDADGSLQRGLEVVEFACGIPHLLKGDYSAGVGTGVDAYSSREPLGVCVGITPFNFPAMVPLWMFPLAIACGNAFVLKPSEKVPSCAMRLAELLAEAGLPDGVFNVLHGARDCVDELLGDPRVSAVSFVGSTPVAQHVYRRAADNGMRAQALGGAKNHMVVMPDADIAGAAEALLGAAYGSAGERCMAVSVAVAVGDVGDALIDALRPRIERLRVGPGTADDVDMGPLITAEHRSRVAGYVDAGVQEGAELVLDGRGLTVPGHEQGFFIGPSLLDRATPQMRIYREEIFGPVLTILRVRTLDEALELVNGHEYGNGAAIFTRGGRAAREFTQRVESGMVGINVPIPVPMAYYSFGGRKRSLFGDSHMHGPEGVRFFTRLKSVTARWPADEADDAHGMDMPTLGR
jgi:malonate-semialdehyde dehydrogenase (acetylating)/methylmalonate-semialdehyde dehydrogenase